MGRLIATLRRWLRAVPLRLTAAGRALVLLWVAGEVAGRFAGYPEFTLIARVCLVVLLLGLGVVLVPTRVRGTLDLRPSRTMAGENAAGSIALVNRGPLPLGNPVLEVPVDRPGLAPLEVPCRTLRRRAHAAVPFDLPVLPRGVHTVGPVQVRRSDPLGLVGRQSVVSGTEELYVRPAMVALAGGVVGATRDLEGVPAGELALDDLSFHALREYVPGDDLRHVHWRSSARTGGQLLVRQYHETRRSHVLVVVDPRPHGYARDRDFELAMSVAASILTRTGLDGYAATFVCDQGPVAGPPIRLLDACCEAGLGAGDLPALVRDALIGAVGVSDVIVVTGGIEPDARLAAARRVVPADVRSLAVVADTALGAEGSAFAPGTMRVGDLGSLPGLLAARSAGAFR